MIFVELIITSHLTTSIQVLQMFEILLCNFLLVQPPPVKIDNFFQNEDQQGCNGTRRVQWQPLDTGNCSIEYNIEFRNSTDGVIDTVRNIRSENTFYCTNDYDNAISVVMWATYNVTQGIKSEAKLFTRTPESTTSTTITSPTTLQKGINLSR